MYMIYRLLPAAAALCFPSIAQAADPIDLDLICDELAGPGTYTVNPVKLRNFVLRGVSLDVLNIDGDDSISSGEMFKALVHPEFCTAGAVSENNVLRAADCKPAEQASLIGARSVLTEFAGAGPFPAHPGVTFRRVEGAPERDERVQAGLEPEAFWPILGERGRFIRMDCRREQRAAGAAGGAADAKRKPAPRFLLTKEIEGLTLQRRRDSREKEIEDLKKVPLAEISFVDDQIGDTETFRVHATAGLDIRLGKATRLIPFAQFVRSHVEDTSGTKAPTETTKLALGTLATFEIGNFDVVDVTALYSNDLEDGNEVLSGRVGWRPGFLYKFKSFQSIYRFGCPAADRLANGDCHLDNLNFGISTDAKLMASAGHVLDVGSNPLLIANREFLRVGGSARITLYGYRGIVRDLSVDVSYRHLFGLTGEPNDISGLTAGINYWIGGSPHVGLRLGYERSQDEETLKRTRQWTASVGVRF